MQGMKRKTCWESQKQKACKLSTGQIPALHWPPRQVVRSLQLFKAYNDKSSPLWQAYSCEKHTVVKSCQWHMLTLTCPFAFGTLTDVKSLQWHNWRLAGPHGVHRRRWWCLWHRPWPHSYGTETSEPDQHLHSVLNNSAKKKKRKENNTAFGVNFMRRHVIYQAAQVNNCAHLKRWMLHCQIDDSSLQWLWKLTL